MWCNTLYAYPVPGNMQISFEIQMCKDVIGLVYSQHAGCIMMKMSKNSTLLLRSAVGMTHVLKKGL